MSDANTNTIEDTLTVGRRLVELCEQGKHREAMEELYADDVVSVEPMTMGDAPARREGKDAIRAKHDQWEQGTEVTDGSCAGPFPHGDRFAVYFTMKGKCKVTGREFEMQEVALYTVRDGKIAQEEFFYAPMG